MKGYLGVITVFLCLGQASSAAAEHTGKLTELLSDLSWEFAVKEGFRVFNKTPATKPSAGSYHTRAGPRSLLGTPGTRSYSSLLESSSAHSSKGALVISPEGPSPRVRELCQRLERFMERHVYPAEPELRSHQASAERWTPSPLVEGLKVDQLSGQEEDLVEVPGPQLAHWAPLFPPQAVKGLESRAGPSSLSSATIPCLWFLALAPVGL